MSGPVPDGGVSPVSEPQGPAGTASRPVDDLLARLTSAERISLLHQHAPAVPRLGLAAFRTGTEALHGVAWLGRATVFPQAVGLGATWDPELVEQVGEAVGRELRARHRDDPGIGLLVWAPVVNLLRDPRWGRNEEGYSEDVLLTVTAAVAYCRGLAGADPDHLRVAPLLKHFLAHNNETDRCTTSSSVRPRVLHEYDLPVFLAPLLAGVAVGVMPAYSLVNGRPNHVSPLLALLRDRVRAVTGRELVVCSDAWAPSNLVEPQHVADDHAVTHALALRAGVDSFTDNDDDPASTLARLAVALDRGLITQDDVDRAARRLLSVRARLGEFDPEHDPHAGGGPDVVCSAEHRELALRAARAQVVLLRNAPELLPLTARPGLRVAVVGPYADVLCRDWYSGTMPYRTTVAAGVRAALERAGGQVRSAAGLDRIRLRHGNGHVRVASTAEPRMISVASGPPAAGTEPTAEFDLLDWGGGVLTLRSVATGRYLRVAADDTLVADSPEPDGWVVPELFTLRDAGPAAVLHSLAAGRDVRVADTGTLTTAVPQAVPPASGIRVETLHRGVDDAVAAAAWADVTVLVVGNDPHINGRETEDRHTLALPPAQAELVRAVSRTTSRTVLVVMSSYPYALTPVLDDVPAVLWTSHAGQETGRAVADVLFGDHPPTGRLPQTWYRDDADLPDLLDYDIIRARRTYQYLDREPLFPFGHGLTYTDFGYGEPRLDPVTILGGTGRPEDDDTRVRVEVEITNTGRRSGTEVVQLYGRAAHPLPDRPRRRLLAFDRLTLTPGASGTAVLEFPLDRLAHLDVGSGRMLVEPGEYRLLVGRSCAAVEWTATLTVTGQRPGPRVLGGIRVAAADFDDHHDAVLVATDRESGDAVAPAGAGPSWLLFRDVDPRSLGTASAAAPAGTPSGRFRARVGRTTSGPARLELRLDHPGRGPLLAAVELPDHPTWTEVSVPLGTAVARTDPCEVYLVMSGEQRVEWFTLEPVAG